MLSTLQIELVYEILFKLSLESICNLMSTCKRFYLLKNDQYFWRQKIIVEMVPLLKSPNKLIRHYVEENLSYLKGPGDIYFRDTYIIICKYLSVMGFYPRVPEKNYYHHILNPFVKTFIINALEIATDTPESLSFMNYTISHIHILRGILGEICVFKPRHENPDEYLHPIEKRKIEESRQLALRWRPNQSQKDRLMKVLIDSQKKQKWY